MEMANFSKLPVEIREFLLNKLPNADLLQCRRVCRDFHALASFLLDRRHQRIWSWNPHFSHSDEDDWVHSKMDMGTISGGLPPCCRRHNFEKTQFSELMSKSLVIWIEGTDTTAKLNQVVAPLLLKHGSLLTSFTLTLDECLPRSICLGDISALFVSMPNLRNFGFKVCNCSIRKKGPYQTRRSQFPPLPHLEVLDLEFNESIAFTDAMFAEYGNQIKRLIVPSMLLEESSYLRNAIIQPGQQQPKKLIFEQLRELKISSINGTYEPRPNPSITRRKYAGRKLFTRLAGLPAWRLERLSLNIDDWAVHKTDRWTVATPELLQMISNFSHSLKELYIYFEYVDKSMDIRDWLCSWVQATGSDATIIPPPFCPNLKKISVDAVLIETPLLFHILKGFGRVEELEFLMWYRYDTRWGGARYALANIPGGNFRPSQLPKMVAKFWNELPTLKVISFLGMNEWPPCYRFERGGK